MSQLMPIFENLRQKEDLPCSYPLHMHAPSYHWVNKQIFSDFLLSFRCAVVRWHVRVWVFLLRSATVTLLTRCDSSRSGVWYAFSQNVVFFFVSCFSALLCLSLSLWLLFRLFAIQLKEERCINSYINRDGSDCKRFYRMLLLRLSHYRPWFIWEFIRKKRRSYLFWTKSVATTFAPSVIDRATRDACYKKQETRQIRGLLGNVKDNG